MPWMVSPPKTRENWRGSHVSVGMLSPPFSRPFLPDLVSRSITCHCHSHTILVTTRPLPIMPVYYYYSLLALNGIPCTTEVGNFSRCCEVWRKRCLLLYDSRARGESNGLSEVQLGMEKGERSDRVKILLSVRYDE